MEAAASGIGGEEGPRSIEKGEGDEGEGDGEGEVLYLSSSSLVLPSTSEMLPCCEELLPPPSLLVRRESEIRRNSPREAEEGELGEEGVSVCELDN